MTSHGVHKKSNLSEELTAGGDEQFILGRGTSYSDTKEINKERNASQAPKTSAPIEKNHASLILVAVKSDDHSMPYM